MRPTVVSPRHRRGFGLLEVILVFALLIGAGVAVFDVFRSAQASAEATDTNERLNTLAANARATFGHDYSPLFDAYSTASGFNGPAALTLLQKVYTVNGTTATGPDGSTVTVNAWRDSFTLNAPDGSMFLITISNIGKDSCAKLLAAVVGNGSNFTGVAITAPNANPYSWIALNNAQVAKSQGYTNNMVSPSFGNYAGVCDFETQFNGSAAIMVVGS